MPVSRDQLLGRIPHAGPMFLLDSVEDFDQSRIRARASGHRNPGHPLRANGSLGSACAVEYAAQAMAAHGALSQADSAPARAGFLVTLRQVRLARARLDDLEHDLVIEARRGAGDVGSVMYEFRVCAGDLLVADGRAVVVLDAQVPA